MVKVTDQRSRIANGTGLLAFLDPIDAVCHSLPMIAGLLLSGGRLCYVSCLWTTTTT